jgi:hypothetical protein
MAEIPFLTLAALTRDIEDAGSGDQLNLTINVAGTDVAVAEFIADHPQAQGYLTHAQAVVSFESSSLTDSSARIGMRGDDAWAPQHILLFGQTSRASVVPIAMETDLTHWLSTDASEGALTIPLRLVALGGSDMPIRRLLLLVRTADAGDAGTDSLVQLQIKANGNLLFSEVITDTPQDDMERGKSNWYEFQVPSPFARADISGPGGGITLTILGDDAWLPASLFLFGLDTASGRPTRLVPLASEPVWGKGWLSTDKDEGQKVASL